MQRDHRGLSSLRKVPSPQSAADPGTARVGCVAPFGAPPPPESALYTGRSNANREGTFLGLSGPRRGLARGRESNRFTLPLQRPAGMLSYAAFHPTTLPFASRLRMAGWIFCTIYALGGWKRIKILEVMHTLRRSIKRWRLNRLFLQESSSVPHGSQHPFRGCR